MAEFTVTTFLTGVCVVLFLLFLLFWVPLKLYGIHNELLTLNRTQFEMLANVQYLVEVEKWKKGAVLSERKAPPLSAQWVSGVKKPA